MGLAIANTTTVYFGMDMSLDALGSLIDREISEVSDKRIIDHIRTLLIEPRLNRFSCALKMSNGIYDSWIVFEDDKFDPNVTIRFCENAHGPKFAWGLIGELITGRKRRRDWTEDEKAEILAASVAPGSEVGIPTV